MSQGRVRFGLRVKVSVTISVKFIFLISYLITVFTNIFILGFQS